MSEGYECDRCGSLHAGSPDSALTVEPGYARSVRRVRHSPYDEGEEKPKHVDLCRVCVNDLRRWYQDAGGDPEDIEYE